MSSFYLWFENQLIKDSLKAYQENVPNNFQYVNFFDIPNTHVGYQGDYRQLVADSDIDFPNTGFFINDSFVPVDASGVFLDYNNGRIVLPASSGQNLSITANSAIKEVNTYLSSDSHEQILLESDFIVEGESRPNFSNQNKKMDENSYFLPACFFSIESSKNDEFCFGGQENTTARIRVMVLSKNNFTMDSILSAFRDSARSCIPLIEFDDFPYGNFFSLKNHPYQYTELSQSAEKTGFIESAKTSRVSGKPDKRFIIGFIDFDISTYRFPRG